MCRVQKGVNMKLVDYIKNVFVVPGKLPDGFVRNPKFDAVLLFESFDAVPAMVRANNGLSYLYFDTIDPRKISLIRKMGFVPHLHKSHKYIPAKYIYRARVSMNMPKIAMDIANEVIKMSNEDFMACQSSPEYADYIAKYKTNLQKQKTK